MLLLRLTRAQAFHLLLISLALPTQYFLSKYTGNDNETSRLTSIDSIVDKLKHLQTIDPRLFMKNLMKVLQSFTLPRRTKRDEKVEESIPVEIFKFQNSAGHFTKSPVVRISRPKNVHFRVGQVVRNKAHGHTGVVIGWDETGRAPKAYQKLIEERRSKEEFTEKYDNIRQMMAQPCYLILIHQDGRISNDGDGPADSYELQDDLEAAPRSSELKNSKITDYFDFYDGLHYHMRPAMRILYPED